MYTPYSPNRSLRSKAMPPRGSIRKRALEHEPSEPSEPQEPKRRGGVKQRALSSDPVVPEPAPKGGVKRRLEKSTSDLVPDDTPSTDALRRDWAKGKIPANQALEYAAGAKVQGAQGLGKMAKEKGLHDKNAHRDLKRALGWPKGAPALRWILVDERTDRHHPVICPLDFVEKFKEEDPEKFQARFVGPAGDIKEYWEGAWRPRHQAGAR